jgi:hypothetical protein
MTDEQATMEGRELADTALRHIRGLEALNAELLTEFSESVKVFEIELATMKKLISKAKRERK